VWPVKLEGTMFHLRAMCRSSETPSGYAVKSVDGRRRIPRTRKIESSSSKEVLVRSTEGKGCERKILSDNCASLD